MILLTFCFYALGLGVYYKPHRETQYNSTQSLSFTIIRVEPYYQQYRIRALTSSFEEIEFTTFRGTFKPLQTCSATLRVKERELNPYSLTKEERLFLRGIAEEFKLEEGAPVYCIEKQAFSTEGLRFRLFQFSKELSPLAEGLFQALVLGVETQLPKEYLETLRSQGLYHQLAISGFNLAVLYGLLYKVTKFFLKFTPLLSLGLPLQLWAGFLALPGAGIVLILSGLQPPALRAFLFLCLLLLGKLLFRHTPSLLVLFLTADILLLCSPTLIGNFSFQLSFMATLGLLWGDSLFRSNLRSLPYYGELPKYLQGLIFAISYGLTVSTIISLFTFPLLLLMAGEISLATPINNLIATPFWSLVFIPGTIFIALIALVYPPIAKPLMEFLAELFSHYMKIPLFTWQYSPPLPVNLFLLWGLIVILLGFFLFKLPSLKGLKGLYKVALWFGISWLTFAGLKTLYDRVNIIIVPKYKTLRAILLKEGKEFYLIVSENKYFSTEREFKLFPLLKKLGIRSLEGLFHLGGESLEERALKERWLRHFEVRNFYSLRDLELWADLKIFKPALEVIPLTGESFLIEFKGLTLIWGEKNYKYQASKIEGEILIHPSGKILRDKIRGEIILERERKASFYLLPKDTYYLYLDEVERQKSFLSRFLFPLYFVEKENLNKRFLFSDPYEKSL
ncbi:MAG: ComEC/Rec2 family competence protein [Caldimicrobium sp.]|nr:ComEC/Rec2 family competence protein [Caldimicrobium sp.]MCX7873268.1 ComEC/Rec2 family competence protein [Caldimicrobium sp.]MDW8094724.1 ComEC/Rec2 family competence protein [Caldimicrobium sp.]